MADIARSLLLTAQLDAQYWYFAWEHACLLSNVMPTKCHDDSSFYPPYFKLWGKHFPYKKLRVWGCKAYPFIGNDKVKKMEDRCLDGFRFVGIDEKSHAFLLLDPDTGDIMLSGMPTFYENLDEYGKVIADYRIAEGNEFFETEVTTDPGLQREVKRPVKGVKILQHRAFVDPEDKTTREVRGIVHIEDVNGIERWLFLDHFLFAARNPDIRKSNWTLWKKYLDNFYQIGNENQFYPLFAEVNVSPADLKQLKDIPSYVCAWDRGHVDDKGMKRPYLVCGAPSSYDPFDVSLKECKFASNVPTIAGMQDVSNLQEFSSLCGIISEPEAGNVTGSGPAVKETSTKIFPPKDYKPPKTEKQAAAYPDAVYWHAAELSEKNSLLDTETFEFMHAVPRGANVTKTKTVYDLKTMGDGSIDKYKCRLVAKGFSQHYGEDFDETWAPVSQLLSMRALCSLALTHDLSLHHMDVSTAFLASKIDDRFNIYVELPERFRGPGGEKYARLKKSLYGLRQAAHDWFNLQEKFIMDFDSSFVKSKSEPCMYTSKVGDRVCVVLVYVDDYLIACNDDEYVQQFLGKFKDFLGAQKVKDLGTPKNLLQMNVDVQKDSIEFSQVKHIEKCAEKFGLKDADCSRALIPMDEGDKTLRKAATPDPFLPYREIIGSLLWIARCTRPDIAHAVAYLGQFSCNYDSTHFKAAKRVLKYLIRTKDLCLTFRKPSSRETTITVFSDADWATDRVDRKSMSGCILYVNGNPVNWLSKRQTTVALSSTESEVYAMSVACTDALHVWSLLSDVVTVDLPIHIYCDNQGAKCIAEQGTNSVRSKWFDTRVHFLRDWFACKGFRFHYFNTNLNVADALTKSLGAAKLNLFRPQLLGTSPVDVSKADVLTADM